MKDKECPIQFAHVAGVCAFRQTDRVCMMNSPTGCIPIHQERYNAAMVEMSLVCCHCGHTVRMPRFQFARIVNTVWECSKCGFEQPI